MFNHPGSNALALKLEEAVLAVSGGPRTTPMSRWHGRGVTIAGDGGTVAASQPLRYQFKRDPRYYQIRRIGVKSACSMRERHNGAAPEIFLKS
jgi:hypothetical protein